MVSNTCSISIQDCTERSSANTAWSWMATTSTGPAADCSCCSRYLLYTLLRSDAGCWLDARHNSNGAARTPISFSSQSAGLIMAMRVTMSAHTLSRVYTEEYTYILEYTVKLQGFSHQKLTLSFLNKPKSRRSRACSAMLLRKGAVSAPAGGVVTSFATCTCKASAKELSSEPVQAYA